MDVVCRGVYRTIELADGWNGRIISTQVYFSAYYPFQMIDCTALPDPVSSLLDVLDGAMVVLAMYTWNILHPGIVLAQDEQLGRAEILTEDKFRNNDGSRPSMMKRRSDV